MKIREIIDRIDSLKTNQYTQEDKINWLSELDSRVNLWYSKNENGHEFAGYNKDTDIDDTVLLLPDAFSKAYIHWLEAQIDYWNGEYARYNNSITLFNTEWSRFEQWYIATHPKKLRFKF